MKLFGNKKTDNGLGGQGVPKLVIEAEKKRQKREGGPAVSEESKQTAGAIKGTSKSSTGILGKLFGSKKTDDALAEPMSNVEYLGEIYKLLKQNQEDIKFERQESVEKRRADDTDEESRHKEIIKALTLRRKPTRAPRRTKKEEKPEEKPEEKKKEPGKEPDKDKAGKDKADKDKADKDKAASDKAAKDKADKDKADKSASDKTKADKDKADKDAADKTRADKDKVDKAAADKKKELQEKIKREQLEKEKELAKQEKIKADKAAQEAKTQSEKEAAKRQQEAAQKKLEEAEKAKQKAAEQAAERTKQKAADEAQKKAAEEAKKKAAEEAKKKAAEEEKKRLAEEAKKKAAEKEKKRLADEEKKRLAEEEKKSTAEKVPETKPASQPTAQTQPKPAPKPETATQQPPVSTPKPAPTAGPLKYGYLSVAGLAAVTAAHEGNAESVYGDYKDKKTGEIKNQYSDRPEVWSKRELGKEKRLTDFTFAELVSYQRFRNKIKTSTGAVGIAGFMPSTLFGNNLNGTSTVTNQRTGKKETFPDGLFVKSKMSWDDKFTEANQLKLKEINDSNTERILKNGGIPLTPGAMIASNYVGASGLVWVVEEGKKNPNITVRDALKKNNGGKDVTKIKQDGGEGKDNTINGDLRTTLAVDFIKNKESFAMKKAQQMGLMNNTGQSIDKESTVNKDIKGDLNKSNNKNSNDSTTFFTDPFGAPDSAPTVNDGPIHTRKGNK